MKDIMTKCHICIRKLKDKSYLKRRISITGLLKEFILVAFRLDEVRYDLVVAPAGATTCGPLIVISTVTTRVDEIVKTIAATQHPTLRQVDLLQQYKYFTPCINI